MSMFPITADRTPDAAASIRERIVALEAQVHELQADQFAYHEDGDTLTVARIGSRIISIQSTIARLSQLMALTEES